VRNLTVAHLLVPGLLVWSCSAAPAASPTPSVVAAGPTLEITSPKPGEVISPPTPVRFAVSDFAVAKGAGHIEVFMPGVPGSASVPLQETDEPGLAYLPADKFLSGKRDLTFVLARGDGAHLDNPEARVTITGLTIQGRR
jgi:hypothetical protein